MSRIPMGLYGIGSHGKPIGCHGKHIQDPMVSSYSSPRLITSREIRKFSTSHAIQSNEIARTSSVLADSYCPHIHSSPNLFRQILTSYFSYIKSIQLSM